MHQQAIIIMKNLTEKRRIIHDWVETAGEEEVDELLTTIFNKDVDPYQQKLMQELNRRRQKHMDGTSGSFTVEEVNARLDELRNKYAI